MTPPDIAGTGSWHFLVDHIRADGQGCGSEVPIPCSTLWVPRMSSGCLDEDFPGSAKDDETERHCCIEREHVWNRWGRFVALIAVAPQRIRAETALLTTSHSLI